MSISSVLFVCHGNICRSPIAAGLLRHKAAKRGLSTLECDSAGFERYHAGDPPDRRAVRVARRHGVELSGVARVVHDRDFEHYDLIVAMDGANLQLLRERCPPQHRGKLELMRRYDDPPVAEDVPDPYYAGQTAFDEVYALLDRCTDGLLQELRGG